MLIHQPETPNSQFSKPEGRDCRECGNGDRNKAPISKLADIVVEADSKSALIALLSRMASPLPKP